MVHTIELRVATDAALRFWAERLAAHGHDSERRDGRLAFADYDGLRYELVVVEDARPLAAAHPEVPAEHANAVAQRAADAVLDSFRSPLDIVDAPVDLGVSIGVALFPWHGTDAGELVRAADQAMYEAKGAGKGRVRAASPARRGHRTIDLRTTGA